MIAGLLGLSLAWAEAPAMTLEATALSWQDGVVSAEGHVVVVAGADRLVAEAARGNAERIELTNGVWYRADGALRFDRAVVWLSEGRAEAEGATVERSGATVQAARLSVNRAGAVVAEDATLTPCACPDGGRPAIRFRAKQVTVESGEATLTGGAVEVFGAPVVPVPWWKEPLDPKRFRLLLPEVGRADYGWFGSVAGRFGVGPEMVTVGPAWREDRGVRLIAEGTGPVRAATEIGWDAVTASPRGAVSTRAGFSGTQRLAWDVTVLSDADYAEDYGPGFVDRGVAWRDRRLTAGWGPVRLAGSLPDDGSSTDLLALRVRPEWRLPGAAVAPHASAGISGPLSGPWPTADVGLDAHVAHTLPLLHVSASADARAVGTLDATPGLGGEAGGEARAELPFWAQAGSTRVQLYAGARAAARTVEGSGLPALHPLQAIPSGWLAGPSVRASTALGDSVVQGELAALATDSGFTPLVQFDAGSPHLRAQVALRTDQQSAELRYSDTHSAAVGTYRSSSLWLAWADATWRPGRFVLGAAASFDLHAPEAAAWTLGGPVALSTTELRTGYDDGCSALIARATLSPDRTLPDFGLSLVLRK